MSLLEVSAPSTWLLVWIKNIDYFYSNVYISIVITIFSFGPRRTCEALLFWPWFTLS